MRKYICAMIAAAMAISMAACSKKDDTSSAAPEESTAQSENVSESAATEETSAEAETTAETVSTSDISYIGKWYFVQMDMTAENMTLSMSLKDMEVTDLTDETVFVMDIAEGGKVNITSDGDTVEADWTQTDSGMTITGDTEALGADILDFTHEDADLIKTVISEDGDTIVMYFAKEGSSKIDDSMNTSLLEQTLGAIMGDMIDENMEELTLDAPAVLTYTEEDTDVKFVRFTAPEAGTYTFRSESDGHDTAAIYDTVSFAEALDISENTEGGFELSLTLEADQPVYIEVTSDSSEVTVTAEKN